MKSRPVGVENILATDQNTRRDDARGGSFLLAHQQLGAIALPTNPTNTQTLTLTVNSTAIVITFVSSIGSAANNVLIGASAAATAANLANFLRRPDLTTSTQIAASAPNQALLQYCGYSLPSGGTTITPFSLNKNVNGATSNLASFTASTTVTGGSWTANTMRLYVEDGTYYIAGVRYLFTGGSTPTVTAPVSNPRIDVLTIDSSGTLAWTTGTENASPVAPAYPVNKVALCELYNVVSETALYDTENQQAGQGYVSNDVRPALGNPYGQFVLDPGSEAQGDVLYYDGSKWARLPAGTSGQFLQTKGASANPQWNSIALAAATGSKSGTPYSVSVNTSPGVALDATNLKITVTGAVGQFVRITAYAAIQSIVTINQSMAVSIVDVTNSTSVGAVVSGGGTINGTFQGYGLVTFYYQLQSTTTVFEMYGYNQSGSNTFTVYNATSLANNPEIGVQQNAVSGGSVATVQNLTTSSFPWFSIEAI